MHFAEKTMLLYPLLQIDFVSNAQSWETKSSNWKKHELRDSKRRLFSDEDSENIALPVLAEPYMLRENTKPPQRLAEDVVGGNEPVEYTSLKAILPQILNNLPELTSYFFWFH